MKKQGLNEPESICANCENAVVIHESDICICSIRGAVAARVCCRRFRPDMLKISPLTRITPENGETTLLEI